MPSEEWAPGRIEQRVDDVLAAIARIKSYVAGVSRDAFLSNPILQDAVARQLLILAEACDKIPQIEKAVGIPPEQTLGARRPNVPWRQIRDLGIVIRHIYGREEPAIYWNTVTGGDLDTLRDALVAEYPRQ